MNKFLEAMRFRHACKIFDENKKIDEDKFLDILESGRLSPSSMGMEPTRFVIIENTQLKRKITNPLLESSSNNKCFKSCSFKNNHSIIISTIKLCRFYVF